MKEIYSIDKNKFYHAVWEDRSAAQQYKQSMLFPKNTYSPWLGDENFLNYYNQIKDSHTLVDVYRCYELWALAKQYANKEGDILEVGVWRGGTGLLLAKGSSETTQIFLCDTFEGVVKATENDSVYKGGEHADTSMDIVNALLQKNNTSNVTILKGIFPEETAHEIENRTFKICHIDVDVYQSAKDIFAWVWKKLVVGGVVVFDDYGFAACEGITTLVNELALEYSNSLKIYNINGHGILIKLSA